MTSGSPLRRLDEKNFVPCKNNRTDNMLTKKAQTVTKVLKRTVVKIKAATIKEGTAGQSRYVSRG